jgi:hypothetical protein
VSSIDAYSLNLDKEFISACLAIKQAGKLSPISPTESVMETSASDALVSITATSGKLALSDIGEVMATDDVRLTDKYPKAYSDFYPSGTPCIFKSGSDWPVRKGPQAQGIEREARPVYGHAIGPTWRSIGESIYQCLDSMSLNWTSINPLAYANAGEAKPFCSLILSIGVKPHSLLYDAAVAATAVVKKILAGAGFPDIEVAFVESVVTRSVAAGPKLLSFDPLLDEVPDLRKPFTTTLGLSIAPLRYPHFEGTGALFFRLSEEDNRTAILTCAHVARPPPVYPNTGMTRKNTSQPREEVVALGYMGYNNAVKAIMSTIRDYLLSIDAWNNMLGRLGDPVQGEPTRVTERRQEHVDLVARAKKEIEQVDAFHDEVTKRRTIPEQRVIGFVLHSEKIEVSVDPHGFTKDWALIELYNEKIDWASFKGNKVYIGTSFSISLSPSRLHLSSSPSLVFFISRLLHLSSSSSLVFFISRLLHLSSSSSLVFFISRRVFHLPSSCLQV